MSAERREAQRRLDELAPILGIYYRQVQSVLSPFLTIGVRPNVATPVVTIDSRGYRVSRNGEETVASEDAPSDATFLLGGSFAFGIGAADDSGTLASALWRRSGRPCVNLGLPRGGSTHEVISALPFGDRTTTFFVCSGGNNFAVAPAVPLDPLFGPSFLDYWLRKLRGPTVEELVHLTWAARKGRVARWNPARRPPRRRLKSRILEDPEAIVATAAGLQLRDLRALRRLVPDEAQVVFALNPVAAETGKELSEEEEAILEAHDVIYKGTDWAHLQAVGASHWNAYASVLAGGCASLGVPFVDLSKAPYTGWCFVDPVHLTDRGNQIAAAFLLDALGESPGSARQHTGQARGQSLGV